MKILIACEFSGRVRDAFIERGFNAMSCDLDDTDSPGPHYKGDVRDILTNGWDAMIAFPPCTYLCASGARWWGGRRQEQQDAIDFFRLLLNAPIPHIAIENPVGIISTVIRKPDQIIQPYEHGHRESKKTCLWLKNLPPLMATAIMADPKDTIHRMSRSPMRSKMRSLTFSGIAKAMAQQWGDFLIGEGC